jgi:excinuclease ABC subunit B
MLEIRKRVELKERTLVVTITKKMAEELTQYLLNKGIRTRYLHSDVAALDRFEILHDLRTGEFDVLVGINLLREGLDLPEVSLIGILDADKEGFLRDERSLIQTMGRAARNMNGTVILYADRVTNSMERAIAETRRRRAVQEAHNTANGITPQTILSRIKDNIRGQKKEQQERTTKKMLRDLEWLKKVNKAEMAPKDLIATIDVLRKEMRVAAKDMEYEKAAILRDKIRELEQDDLSKET